MVDLMERLCRCLAFHARETELTSTVAEGDVSPWLEAIAEAKALIAEAGFDFDVLYPPEDRPTISDLGPSTSDTVN